MKNFNTLEMCIAFFITLVASVIAGVAPDVAASVAFVYFFSYELTSDIIRYKKSGKLPSLYEGLGDVYLFFTITFAVIGLKCQNFVFYIASLAFIFADCVLMYVQVRVDKRALVEDLKKKIKD